MLTPQTIKRTRLRLGMTQARMAEQLGIDTSTIARYESGKVRPSAHVAARIRALAPTTSCPLDAIRASAAMKFVFDLSDISRGVAISRGGAGHVGLSTKDALRAMNKAIGAQPADDCQIRRLINAPEMIAETVSWAEIDYRGHLTNRWYRCIALPVYADRLLVCEFEEITDPPENPRFHLYGD